MIRRDALECTISRRNHNHNREAVDVHKLKFLMHGGGDEFLELFWTAIFSPRINNRINFMQFILNKLTVLFVLYFFLAGVTVY